MSSKTYSNTRTKATWKPRVGEADLPFFTQKNGNVLLGLGGGASAYLTEPGRNPVFNLPYAEPEAQAPADGSALRSELLLELGDLPEEVALDYAIMGGYNNNAVEFTWRIEDENLHLQWVALKTFTGLQVKYVTPKKRQPIIFALADEDAYVYCDESPCLECVFMCKRGFVLYAHVSGLGTVRIPLTRASAYWESRD